MRTWFCCLSLLFAVSGWARIPVPPPDMPAPPVVRTVDVRADETPVSVAAWHVEARVSGAFATVTTSFTVHNPNARPLEGALEFPLPDGARVCGLALDIDGVIIGRDGPPGRPRGGAR